MNLKTLCQNYTLHARDSSVLTSDEENNPSGNGTVTSEDESDLEDRDRHALLYIVVVLLFYSTGIIIGIIMYLKREKEEIVEDKVYDDYITFRSDPDKWARYFRVQRMISHLNHVEELQNQRRAKRDKGSGSSSSSSSRKTKRSKQTGSKKQRLRVTVSLSTEPSVQEPIRLLPKPKSSQSAIGLSLAVPGLSPSPSGSLASPLSTELYSPSSHDSDPGHKVTVTSV